jgi:hypothetical protein
MICCIPLHQSSKELVPLHHREIVMDIKKEVRRRIEDLTRVAHAQGYRDGAQSALTEIERFGADDMPGQMAALSKPGKAVAGAGPTTTRRARRAAASRKPAAAKGAVERKPASAKEPVGKSKSVIVQEVLQRLLAEKGEARRDEILKAAQAANPAITRHDLNNGLRVLAKRSAFRVAPDDSSRLLPAEAVS